MEIPKIHEGEYRFCLIMWEHEPISAAQLVKLCQEQLGWKRTTTYTVIKRLGERGILKNEDGIVTALVSKDKRRRVRSMNWWKRSLKALFLLLSLPLPNGRIYLMTNLTKCSR